MWQAKEMLDNQNDDQRDRVVAKTLGISVHDLQATGYWIEDNVGNDDMVYDHTVYFGSDAPQAILKRVHGIDMNSRTATLPLGTFDSPDYDEQED